MFLKVFLNLFLLCSSSFAAFVFPDPSPLWNEFNVLDYGAKGDGIADDSQALLVTWKLACHADEATMIVPAGKIFIVTSIVFAGPCSPGFKLKIDGTVVAPRDTSRWTRLENWISIVRVHDFTVEGSGVIDGQGDAWWIISCKRNSSYACQRHPTALSIRGSTNVLIQGLKLVNSPQMHLALEESSNISIRGLEIFAPHDSPNTDGIHLHMSKNVTIEKCVVGTGDDCVSVGTNSSNVLIRGLICGPGHGISVGSLGRNKAPEFVSNVVVENSVLTNTMYGLRVKTWQGGQGFATNFSYYNVVMMNVLHPIIIDQFYCDGNSSFTCGTQEVDAVRVSNILYANIMGTSASKVALRFQCSLNNPCDNLILENVSLHMANGSIPMALCINAFGENRGLVIPQSCLTSKLSW